MKINHYQSNSNTMMKKVLASLALFAAVLAAGAQNIPQAAKDRAAGLVKQMTLEEKVLLIAGTEDGFHTAGIPRLGIPSIYMCDGPQGVRNKTISTLYPCGVAAAASWNREAMRGMGQGIGLDARSRGVGIMLGPGVNIYRSPVNGRNFEYFGEDPFLASETAVQYIKGMQAEGVMATIKHFAMNNQEYDRHGTGVVVDERTAQEIYFPTFRRAVQEAGVGAIMTSYNMINGQHAPENPWLIRETLRDQWGFEGLVMSDWTSTYSTLGCILGGLDLEMPKNYVYHYDLIKEMIDNGVVAESLIDEKVQHILQTCIAFGLFDRPLKDESVPADNELSRAASYRLAVEAPVLLKNNGVLPLKPGKKNKTVLIGPMADVMPCGGGSGEVHPFEERSITMKMGFEALGKKFPFQYVADPEADVKAIEEAKTVVVAVGYDKKLEKENSDRTFALPEGQDALIDFALAHNPNVVVVIVSGGEVDMSAWLDRVAAVLVAWYDGQDLGTAVAEIAAGKVNPSGRLPMTFWGSLEKNPCAAHYEPTMTALKNADPKRKSHVGRFSRYSYTEYAEGIFVGYRGAGHFGIKPLFPFGYGLSYTNFSYEGFAVAPVGDGFDVTVTLRNTGALAGSDVVQVYVAPISPQVPRPLRELKGFEKVRLEKGEAKTVTVHLPKDAFAYYDVASHGWKVDAGTYKVQLASDAEKVLAEETVNL